MELKEVLRFADEKVFSKTGKHLDDLQEAILKEAIQGRKYATKIAQDRDCSEGYVRVAASELWKILSDVFGEEVSKGNVRAILERANFYNSPSAILSNHVTFNHVNVCQERARSPTETQNPEQTPKQIHIDLGDAPEIFSFFDRTPQLSTLENWITQDRTRLIALLGISGIGKTTLALCLIDQIKTQFDYIIYRSLRFSPTLEQYLSQILKIFSESSEIPQNIETQISQILDYLRKYRCLIILDDVQALFSSGQLAGQYKSGYEDYQLFFKQITEVNHNSCFLLISSEKPREITELEKSNSPIHSLVLGSLGLGAKEILSSYQLLESETWETLINIYQGNPLWLNITAALIRELFSGKVTDFLQYDMPLLDKSLQSRLEKLLGRLTEEEVTVITQLFQETEALTLAEILNKTQLSHSDLINAIKSLCMRFLLETQEREKITFFTLNSVMMQYVKTRQKH
ncbi:ATP-binding protein [Limnoraphis robusta]|uniref:ATP-binding protein n=1 Tax=Limnoraphis robusta CCNP1315 TaxID=3110306 RepID=A0ABU5U114_9CYAN|nr:ATP-binding protein [Limnoraphis robusta]MEA5520617.1 ATP-binding protein [Limnoraphis robusta CCNP1315]MEA5548863.1 ATP-binding protein [Limnoraphis robusta CCNP1324]